MFRYVRHTIGFQERKGSLQPWRPALESGEERGEQQRLTHPVVDADEEDAARRGEPLPGPGAPAGAEEEGGGQQRERALGPTLEALEQRHERRRRLLLDGRGPGAPTTLSAWGPCAA